LGKHVLVALERTLRLQKSRAVRTRIDVNQRIALTYQLTLLKMHGHNRACHLAGNRIGIERGNRTDGVKINADVTCLSRRASNRDLRRRGLGFVRGLVMAPHQHDCQHCDEQQQNPYDDPHYFASVRFRTVSRELMVTIDEGLLIRVNGQKESPFSAANPQHGT